MLVDKHDSNSQIFQNFEHSMHTVESDCRQTETYSVSVNSLVDLSTAQNKSMLDLSVDNYIGLSTTGLSEAYAHLSVVDNYVGPSTVLVHGQYKIYFQSRFCRI